LQSEWSLAILPRACEELPLIHTCLPPATPELLQLLNSLKIGLVRRGFSSTGGAESYLKRLGRALTDANHQAILYSTKDWPAA
jgi:hypothetical protein